MDSKKTILIDLGTNTAILSVVEVLGNRLIISYEKSITTRIGQNIGKGPGKSTRITQEALERNLSILKDELKRLRTIYHAEKICGITTEAIRNAENGAECLRLMNEELGSDLHPITGDEEALYTFFAVRHLVKKDSSLVCVCDIGGGSTEFSFSRNDRVEFIKSLPIGVVRLEEAFHLTSSRKGLADAQKKINETLDTAMKGNSTPVPDMLFLSGGTATTVAAMMMGMRDYDPLPIEGTLLTRQKVDALLERLLNLSPDQIREELASDPGRYDVITAGVLMIRTIMDRLHPGKTVVTTFGPRHGYLLNSLGIKDAEDIIYRFER